MSWIPLLDGEPRARADVIVRGIAAALRAPRDGGAAHLSSGDAGHALLFAYLARSGLGDFGPAEERLERAMDAVGAQPMSAELFSGFTGIAWVAEHLQDRDCPDDVNDALVPVLGDHLATSPWRGAFDLITGLVGIGLFALEGLHRPGRRALLATVVDRLHDTAQPTAHGLAWRTPPEQIMMARARAAHPDGYYDLGLAHGVPGIIALLGQAIAADVATARAWPLLRGAVAWLLARRAPAADGSHFPPLVATADAACAAPGCRLAWCYGDAGIAVALLGAARAVGDRAWEAEAIALAHEMARRDVGSCGVRDAGLCHGAAGLAHIYNRLWQATRDPVLHAAARHWLEITVGLWTDTGIGGYQFWTPREPDFAFAWTDDPGVLTGSAGVALALLAAISADEPRWDQFLLTAVPPIPIRATA
ncbi:MAG: lanthionine synthetase C family protein [Deltaproteobacteria bacterium]|nr:lanthionine synthetase C family protein [Deltaproteobacteria bacterium]